MKISSKKKSLPPSSQEMIGNNNDLIAYVRFRFRAYNTAEIFGVYIKEDQRIEEHNVDILRWRRREVFK